MSKCKTANRDICDTQPQANVKRLKLSHLFTNLAPLRRSARLEEKSQKAAIHKYLPSPASSHEHDRIYKAKRKSEDWGDSDPSYGNKRRKLQDSETKPEIVAAKYKDAVAYWVHKDNRQPPADYFDNNNMAPSRSSLKRPRTSESSGTGRTIERYDGMKEHGICMDDTMQLSQTSRKLCDKLLLGDREPAGYPMYRAEHRHKIQALVATEGEAIIQRDILPIVVPSAQNLHIMGVIEIEQLRDEMDATWSKATTMGDTQPKPDYVAGLRRSTFDQETWAKLMNYATADTPVLLSTVTCFPLVIAEVKRGTTLEEARYQLIHAGAMAVRQQIRFFQRVYGKTDAMVKELYGQALVYSVYLNHDKVYVLAHYALLKEGTTDQIEWCYCTLAMYSLTMNNGRDENKPYNFVENVYKICGPQHVKRIQDAAKLLGAPVPALSTGSSFSFSEPDLDNELAEDSQGANDGEAVFKKPKPLVSAVMSQELTALRRMIEEQKMESKQREDKLETRLQQQREDSKQREDRLETQLQQQREDSKQQLDQLLQTIETLHTRKET